VRKARVFIVCALMLACGSGQNAKLLPVPERAASSIAFPAITAAPAASAGQARRQPDTENGQPGQWPQAGKRRMVDVVQLKSEAKELTNLSNELPAQMEQIGNGRLPKELIENLKKIEKLAKHIRGEVS
jgi:hypothetical protein